MLGARVRRLRREQGLTQAELAARAGVSRQLVGAVEHDRHLPRVDAAVGLARALGVSVEALVDEPAARLEGVVGALPRPGALVRVGRVGARLVCHPAGVSWDGWAAADGVLSEDGVELVEGARPGVVAVGCDPSLGLAARQVGAAASEGVVAVAAATAAAVAALAAGRAHACVVHGLEGALPDPPVAIQRWHLCRWQVGLAAPTETAPGWWRDVLGGGVEVVQREAGAGSQAAFERAVAASGGRRARGPTVAGHLEAAWLAGQRGTPAVTIEPAALVAGLAFHPLEVHTAELWVAEAWIDEPGVRRLLEALTSRALSRRLTAVGGYDLSGGGTRVA
jgi:DNA-binding XRE family transcriptional regulator/molybdate-binding protein